jgi:hypothetical protein
MKWMEYAIGHNCHGPQPCRPNQAYNKLKCYELIVVNGKQTIYLHIPSMQGASARSIRSVDVEGHRRWVFYLRPLDFLQLFFISFLQNIE